MEFNEEKFQLIKYETREDFKMQTKYENKSGKNIEQTNKVKDLGVTMSYNLNIESHHQVKINEAQTLSGWIRQVFKTRVQLPMLTLFNSLMLPKIKYCCILALNSKSDEINYIEGIQRLFTAQIDNIKHMNHWE